jgi:hypothetical protein
MTIPAASEAREIATNTMAVFTEIQLIEKAIMDAIAGANLTVKVGPDSSPPVVSGMTNSTNHYNSWVDPVFYNQAVYQLAREQMSDVISHFQKKGYVVRRERVPASSTFNWVIKW